MIAVPRHAEIDEVLATTRTTRRRLDLSRPVPRELIGECVSLAVRAPNGANRQSWHFIVIDDEARRAAVADCYRRASADYLAGDSPDAASARFLAENLARVPVLLLACAHGRLGPDDGPRRAASLYGSLYPAVWSFMLAARARGLGTALTTVHLALEREVAEILGIPHRAVTQGPLVPVAYRSGPAPRPAARRPLSEVVSWNRWERAHP
jgi:nitroreductase